MKPRCGGLVQRQIREGINFLVPCGTTGESPTLTRAEHLRVVEITVEEARKAGRKVPVVGGAGGYNTAEVIELAKELQHLGVDGLLSVTPYYNKVTQEGLYRHYKAIADAVPLPIIVYNVPGRTGVNVETATLKRLAEIENICGVKEASGNISQMAAVCHNLPDTFDVLVRRRCADDSAVLAGRARLDLGGLEPDSGGDDQAGATRDGRGFRGGARVAAPVVRADGSEFRGVESDSGEGFDGDDGLVRTGLPPADVPAAAADAVEN